MITCAASKIQGEHILFDQIRKTNFLWLACMLRACGGCMLPFSCSCPLERILLVTGPLVSYSAVSSGMSDGNELSRLHRCGATRLPLLSPSHGQLTQREPGLRRWHHVILMTSTRFAMANSVASSGRCFSRPFHVCHICSGRTCPHL